MSTPEDPTHPEEQPSATNRRTRLLVVAGAAAAVVVVGGIVYAVTSTKPDADGAELALNAGRALDELKTVRRHVKMQAFGTNYLQHRPIEVGPYPRRVPRAA